MAGNTDATGDEHADPATDVGAIASTADASDTDATGAANANEDRRVAVGSGDAVLSVPADADPEEAAAIATAIGAHLADSARAVARAESDVEPEPADRWRLAARLRGRTLPREVTRGEEWAAAARSQW